MADKASQLADLKKRMDEDKDLPLRSGATQLVFGEGNPDAHIYCLGEGPGFHEDKQGRPFVGLAGKLLNETLEEIGLKRSEVYISNVVRFRPPENRDPFPEELAAFAPYVDEEIKIIDPEIIVTLGRFSMAKFLPDVKISQVHGQPRLINFQGKQITVVPMYHPAAALRATAVLNLFKADFQILKNLLEGKAQPVKIEEPQKNEQTEEEKKKKSEQLSLI